jgi:hypothetical protein
MPDGRLWLIRDTYAAETAWAPRHVGKELRLSRLGAFDATLGAIRSDAEAEAARKTGDHPHAKQHEALAASYRALRDLYQLREHAFTQAMADRQEWEHATKQPRHVAIVADAELRRRHPDQKIEPLRSADLAAGDERERLFSALKGEHTETVTWIRDLAAQHHAFRARMDERQRQVASSENLAWASLGETLLSPWAPRRDAILQPPKPQIAPSATIHQPVPEHDAEREAAN